MLTDSVPETPVDWAIRVPPLSYRTMSRSPRLGSEPRVTVPPLPATGPASGASWNQSTSPVVWIERPVRVDAPSRVPRSRAASRVSLGSDQSPAGSGRGGEQGERVEVGRAGDAGDA